MNDITQDGAAYAVQPTPEEAAAGLTPADLGIRVLVPEAGAAARARAEAHFAPVGARLPCRCSGTGCLHGKRHDGCEADDCQWMHLDRYPGSMFDRYEWADDYQADRCGETVAQRSVTLPDLPWGKTAEDERGTYLVIYRDVRHPNFGSEGGVLRTGTQRTAS
jgi:hypothetical protein